MVVFTSNRDLGRAENLKAVYDAYDGEKRFAHMNEYITGDVQVTDELPYICALEKCIFIGHGMGACKTYGLDQPQPYFNWPGAVTYAIASSEEMVPLVAKQIGIKREQVIPLGMPRTDLYFADTEQKNEILYCPTFRRSGWKPDFNEIDRLLPDGCTFIVKPHMLTDRLMQNNLGKVREESSRIPTTPFLLRCRTLVTDYSSIMFDAMVLRKPIVLFAKDVGYYRSARGFYFPYPDCYSERFADSESKLIDLCGSARWTDCDEELRTFYAGSCDGHSVERVLELIRRLEK